MRLFERQISKDDVVAILKSGEVIQDYTDDQPYPSFLVLGYARSNPLHVLVARDEATSQCYVVTAYAPDPAIWAPDFRRKRS